MICSKSFSAEQKLESVFHLLANMGWLFGTIITLTLYPVIYWRVDTGPYQLLRLDIPLFLGSSGLIMLYFLCYAVSRKEQNLYRGLILLPVLAIGMAPSIALSVLAGIIKKGGYFKRTPKFGCLEKKNIPITSLHYYKNNILFIFFNVFFLVYTLLPLMMSANRKTWIAAPFLAIFPLGFIFVILTESIEAIRASKLISRDETESDRKL